MKSTEMSVRDVQIKIAEMTDADIAYSIYHTFDCLY
jgi:hypothetical protein